MQLFVKRYTSLFLYIAINVALLLLIGYIRIGSAGSLIYYQFYFNDIFAINSIFIIFVIIAPMVLSYLMGILRIGNSDKYVQILGPNSLMNRIELEFNRANPDAKEYSDDNLKLLLIDMSRGEPEGTYENLELMLGTALICKNTIDKVNATSIKRVYIANEDLPNAFTIRILPIPFIGEDWIVINRNLVEILNEAELASVIGHEIAHTKHFDSWFSSISYSPRLISLFVTVVLLFQLISILVTTPLGLVFAVRLTVTIMVLFLMQLVSILSTMMNNYSNKITEIRADLYATENFDANSLINALYKIYIKGYIYLILTKESNKLLAINSAYYSIVNKIRSMISLDELSVTAVMKIIVDQSIRFARIHNIDNPYIEMRSPVIDNLKKYDVIILSDTENIEERIYTERSIYLNDEDIARLISQIKISNSDELYSNKIIRKSSYEKITHRILYVHNKIKALNKQS